MHDIIVSDEESYEKEVEKGGKEPIIIVARCHLMDGCSVFGVRICSFVCIYRFKEHLLTLSSWRLTYVSAHQAPRGSRYNS